MLIDICITLFIIMEFANVMALYFNPDTKQFNGMGVFKAWQDLKDHEKYGDVARGPFFLTTLQSELHCVLSQSSLSESP